jgi:F-type H+-transporting ATPase subunit gamma
VTDRIQAVKQLGAVVNVMRGTAGARVTQARAGLEAVRGHAAVLEEAIRKVLTLIPPGPAHPAASPEERALVVFGAEQGFVGGFTDRILDGLADELGTGPLLLVGTRAQVTVRERGITPDWSTAMPMHIAGIPGLADEIVEALFQQVAQRGVRVLETVRAAEDESAGPAGILERRRVFPLEPDEFASPSGRRSPRTYQDPELLLRDLTEEYVHSQLCDVALRAFIAESQARMAVMATAHRQVDRRMDELNALGRQLRQQEITAEIIELSSGVLRTPGEETEGA